MNPHLKRWLTGIIAIPILIYLIGFSPRWIFYAIIYLFSLAGLIEFYKLTSPDLSPLIKHVNYLLTLVFFILIYMGQLLAALLIILSLALIPMICLLFSNPLAGDRNSSDIGKAVMGPVYVALPLAMIIPIDRLYLLNHSIRGIWIFFLLAVTFANDTGAFYCGKLFGKHKLYESVSPNKTWEGSIGGIIFALIIAALFLRFLGPHPISPAVFALTLAMSIAGQIGDLAESMLKRNHEVKDSGGILPGHGGVLDRIDSLLFSIPVLYLYLVFNLG
jgi:phosphatidate cytidylyltransferase